MDGVFGGAVVGLAGGEVGFVGGFGDGFFLWLSYWRVL